MGFLKNGIKIHSIKLVFFVPTLADSCHVLGYNMLELPVPA